MRSVSIRDLRYEFSKVEALLLAGESLQLTRRRKVIARIVPETQEELPELPDFAAHLKEIYGDQMLAVSGAELIRQDRERF
jgi:antitoxin (DNA-binding transcriptional repressor) of toxin-antitoxin stability system